VGFYFELFEMKYPVELSWYWGTLSDIHIKW